MYVLYESINGALVTPPSFISLNISSNSSNNSNVVIVQTNKTMKIGTYIFVLSGYIAEYSSSYKNYTFYINVVAPCNVSEFFIPSQQTFFLYSLGKS